jgi:hypothetical protein
MCIVYCREGTATTMLFYLETNYSLMRLGRSQFVVYWKIGAGVAAYAQQHIYFISRISGQEQGRMLHQLEELILFFAIGTRYAVYLRGKHGIRRLLKLSLSIFLHMQQASAVAGIRFFQQHLASA